MRLALFVILGSLGAGASVYAAAETAQTAAPTTSKRFVVTLISSFDPIDDSLVPTDLSGLQVYRTQGPVFGKMIYFVRAGFFASEAEANIAKDRLRARFPSAFVTEVTPEEIPSAAKPTAPAVMPTPPPVPVIPKPAATPLPSNASPAAARPAAVARDEFYTITLLTKATGVATPRAPLPDELAGQRLYLQNLESRGKSVSTLNLGFFGSATEAEKARQLLSKTYPNAKVRTANQEERDAAEHNAVTYQRNPTLAASVPSAPAAPSAAAPSAAAPSAAAPSAAAPSAAAPSAAAPSAAAAPVQEPAPDSSIEKQAADLMATARAALERKDNATAVQVLDQLLKLPPNRQSQDAQELVGLARERLGDIALARQEYNLYLKLYPQGEGADRVRQRLANIQSIPPQTPLKATKPRDVQVTTVYGSWAQYYYRGDSKIDTTSVPTVGPTVVLPTLTSTNQSTLISDLNLTGRMRSGEWDDRVVIRDTYNSNFLANTNDQNRLYSAYAEIHNKVGDYGGRLGRQPGTPGVLNRFDGISLGYALVPKWRLNLVAGRPVDFYPINSEKNFWSTYLDYGIFAEHWGGNLYYVQQTIDGILDRQAIGNELRFFDPKGSALLLLDYDLSYSQLNIAMFQGTWLASPDNSFNLLLDHRYAPSLATANALIGASDTSIKSQLLTQSESQLRAQALAQTPTANTYLLGATHNFNQTWQMNGSISLYNMSGTAPNTVSQGISATGNTLVYNIQGIMLTHKRDTTVLSLNYLTGPTTDGYSLTLSDHTTFSDRWLLDTSLSYYHGTTSEVISDTSRITPRIRIAYRFRDNVTFEAEASLEKTTSHTTTTNTITNISTTDTQNTDYRYYSIGYRWDF